MHEKEIEKLQAEKEKVERQLAQEQHKIQRLENRAAYYEKGERAQAGAPAYHSRRSHRECRTADERVGRNRVYTFAERVFALPDAQRLLMEAVSRHAGGD